VTGRAIHLDRHASAIGSWEMATGDAAPRLLSFVRRYTGYIALDDVDAHHARARQEGAEVGELIDQDYGSREYIAKDPEGNTWSFGTYRP
jgi:uncharacterized glyoxalase superfamily protein PhnB